MKVNDDAYNCVCWLMSFLEETIKGHDGSDKSDMETRLMKAESLIYTIRKVEDYI